MTSKFDNKRFLKAYTIDKGVFRSGVVHLDNVLYINTAGPMTCSRTRKQRPGAYVSFGGDMRSLLIAVHEDEEAFIQQYLT